MSHESGKPTHKQKILQAKVVYEKREGRELSDEELFHLFFQHDQNGTEQQWQRDWFFSALKEES